MLPALFIIGQAQLPGWELLKSETIKAIPSAVIAAIGALLAVGVGRYVSHYWAIRQKRRELELTTLNDLYRLYGDFVATWKLWNHHCRKPEHLAVDNENSWKLLERASSVESGMEAILVKIASERILTNEQIAYMGLIRQAFQSLREGIREGRQLDWSYSGHEEYVAFKSLSSQLAGMLLSDEQYERPDAEKAESQILTITDNINEQRWAEIGEREKAKNARE